MECPSCGAVSELSDCCGECGSDLSSRQNQGQEQENSSYEVKMNPAGEASDQQQVRKSSTLIEFPGVSRSSVPEWRKELSERVREVHERRAREAAREAAESHRQQSESVAAAPQLELLPQAELPSINPLVAAALRRIERAHRATDCNDRPTTAALATAVAYAPSLEENCCTEPSDTPVLTTQLGLDMPLESAEVQIDEAAATEDRTKSEKTHGLVVVAPQIVTKAETVSSPRRLILDDPNDPALNYLDSISRTGRLDEIATKRATAIRRAVCAVFDLIICAALSSPVPACINLAGTSLQDPRAIVVMAGSFVIMIFVYQMLTTALTGRTWAMRLLSLRIIDRKTGLIPTGGQSAGRAFLYLLSIATAGLGILFALISRDGYTAYDRITRTEVITT
jgi:uncharacterized RDD family membrane protein YckC